MKRRKERLSVFLASTTEVEGHLTFKGSARVDGRFIGGIAGDGTVFVGPSARLHSDIHSPEIILGGYLEGVARGSRRVEISPGGYVKGTINAPVLVVAEGALFDGRCVMRDHDEGDRLPAPD